MNYKMSKDRAGEPASNRERWISYIGSNLVHDNPSIQCDENVPLPFSFDRNASGMDAPTEGAPHDDWVHTNIPARLFGLVFSVSRRLQAEYEVVITVPRKGESSKQGIER